MWLDKLKELKKAKGLSSKQIAEITNLPERTVSRIFSGDTDDPYASTLRSIVIALDGSLDDIFAETSAVVGTKKLKDIQADYDALKAEYDILAAEYAVLKDKVTALTSENDILRLKLEHKEEIIAIHNYYNKLK
jgi:transcriptional regulator with XRE-family HTH domain